MSKRKKIKRGRIRQKFEAAVNRGYYNTIDLFAGCGGMTLGFERAGFRCVSAVEKNKDARESHRTNFSYGADYAIFSDISQTLPEEVVRHLRRRKVDLCADIVIGGPPCQAFSRLGRAALWDIAGKSHAHFDDPRATMYEYYLDFVRTLKPIAFVMENVKEMAKFGKVNIAHEIAATTEEMGYTTRYAILNAVWYGVPQLRERLIIIGIHKDLDVEPVFPIIRYNYELPVGYSTSRAGNGKAEVLPPYDYYVNHYEVDEHLTPAVTVEEALADIPPITCHLDGRTGRGHVRDMNAQVQHLNIENPYIREMTNWPGYISDGASTGHVIRYTPRDYEIFRRMPHGGMYPEAIEVAEMIFSEKIEKIEAATGKKIEKGSEEWEKIRKTIVPPYKLGRYPNKFRKMWPDHPARTLPAHLEKDSYSHIHFDSEQARAISVREAARLQSFPDSFEFTGSMNSQFRQIGNAVPPLMAYAIAKALQDVLESRRS